LPDGRAVAFDAGSSSTSDIFRGTVEPFLRHEGIRSIDTVFLSHGDFDHISLAGDLVRSIGVGSVRISPHFRRHAAGNIPAEELLDLLDHSGPAPVLTKQGDRLDLGDGTCIDVLWPPAQCAMNSNNCGMVLRLTYAGRSILLPADIQEPAEAALLARNGGRELKSDILIGPHHGSAEVTTPAFIKAVDPQAIVCSNERRLTQKQKLFDTLTSAWPVYRTSRCGAVTVTIASDGKIRVDDFLGVKPAGTVENASKSLAVSRAQVR
jgi:competence protein ComEC